MKANVDFRGEREERDRKLRFKQKEIQREQRLKEKEEQLKREANARLKSYDHVLKAEAMSTNKVNHIKFGSTLTFLFIPFQDDGNDSDDFM